MIDAILIKLKTVFSGKPWYSHSLMDTLENVNADQAFLKISTHAHSIAELVCHMTAWKTFVLKKLKAEGDFDIQVNSEKDWPVIEEFTVHEWEKLKHELVHVQEQLVSFLEEKGGQLPLKQKVPGRNYDYGFLLEGMIQHDIYHQGQIALLFRHFSPTN